MDIPEIHSARTSERERAIAAIVLGFAADPIMRWVWPEPADYLSAMPRMVAAFGGAAFECGSAYVTDGYRGTALWLPPGVEPDTEALQALLGETVPEARLEELGGFLEGMAASHPRDEPHWYLPLVAVDPRWHGGGLGSALMKHAVQRCDAEGLMAYLEATSERNLALYERYGFEVVAHIQAGSSPTAYGMLRRPA